MHTQFLTLSVITGVTACRLTASIALTRLISWYIVYCTHIGWEKNTVPWPLWAKKVPLYSSVTLPNADHFVKFSPHQTPQEICKRSHQNLNVLLHYPVKNLALLVTMVNGLVFCSTLCARSQYKTGCLWCDIVCKYFNKWSKTGR